MRGEGASSVISHAAAESCIHVPMFEATSASHRPRNSESCDGTRRSAWDQRLYTALSFAVANWCAWRLKPTYAAVAPLGMSSLSTSRAKIVK